MLKFKISRLEYQMSVKMHEKNEDDFEEEEPQILLPPTEKERFMALLQPFATHLYTGKQALGKKRRTFFEFLFGRHPKVILSMSLYSALHELDKLRTFLETKKTKLATDFAAFFNHFALEVNKTWNPRLYDTRFHELFNAFEALSNRLQEEEI
jgi:hypothetical protein